jgi:hypothetical protein
MIFGNKKYRWIIGKEKDGREEKVRERLRDGERDQSVKLLI